MDWNSTSEDDNRRMLKRIVAVLFALAGLAERLTGLPRPLRGFVLLILGSAETVARDFVLETTHHHHGVTAPLPACFGALQTGDSPADALRLAQSFRVLAVLLASLAGRGCRPGNPSSPAARAPIVCLLAAMSHELRQLLPATAELAVERRDSS